MQKNFELRQKVENSGIFYWQIAEKLGVSDATLCRWLRHELSNEKKSQIFAAITELEAGEMNEG